MSRYNDMFKLIFVGKSKDGKTSLIGKFSGHEFNQQTESTIGVDFLERTVDVGGTATKFVVWDTSGQPRFDSVVNSFYKGSDLVVFVISYENIGTLNQYDENWDALQHNVQRVLPRNTPICIVINKIDVADADANRETHEADTKQKVSDWLLTKGEPNPLIDIQCCSAKVDEQATMDKMFSNFVRHIHKNRGTENHHASLLQELSEITTYEHFCTKIGENFNGKTDTQPPKAHAILLITMLISVRSNKGLDGDDINLFYNIYQELQQALTDASHPLAYLTRERGILRDTVGRTTTYERVSDLLATAVLEYYLVAIKAQQSLGDTARLHCHAVLTNHNRYGHFFGLTSSVKRGIRAEINRDPEMNDEQKTVAQAALFPPTQ